MDRRPELDRIFKSIVGDDHVYFQPPSSVKMKYPAIRYKRTRIDTMPADNLPYKNTVGYEVTVIDRNPDSEVTKAVMNLPMCRHNRNYFADNLNHDVFVIYY